jgi:hypothetical protein
MLKEQNLKKLAALITAAALLLGMAFPAFAVEEEDGPSSQAASSSDTAALDAAADNDSSENEVSQDLIPDTELGKDTSENESSGNQAPAEQPAEEPVSENEPDKAPLLSAKMQVRALNQSAALGVLADSSVLTIDFSQMDGEKTYTLSYGDKPVVVLGEGTLILNHVSITAPDGFSAIRLGDGAKVTVEVNEDCSLTGGKGGAGIEVAETASLTLTGSGTLTAIGNAAQDTSDGGSGIGSCRKNDKDSPCGTITIDHLAGLTAQGYGKHAAGIGGAGSAPILIQNTVIDTVRGGGSNPKLQSDYGKSDFEGGPAIGTGIGSGCADITLESVQLKNAYGGSKAAAIGGGYHVNAIVHISGCTLENVIGGSGASGIGGSRINGGGAATITIENSNIEVSGGDYGAGLGLGYNVYSVGEGQPKAEIVLENSRVTAFGGMGGAAIGGGYKGHNVHVAIAGGSTYAQSGSSVIGKPEYYKNSASAIGAGANGSADFSAKDCTFTADAAADITAVALGGRWAIDCGTSSAEDNILQLRFLNEKIAEETKSINWDSVAANYYDYQAKDMQHALNTQGTSLIGDEGATIQAGSRTVTLPAGYYTMAVSQPAAGTYTVSSSSFPNAFASYTVESYADASAGFAVTGLPRFDHVAFRPGIAPPATPAPTAAPTAAPTLAPSAVPTAAPTAAPVPTPAPTHVVRRASVPTAVPAPTAAAPNAPAVTVDEENTPLAPDSETSQPLSQTIDDLQAPLAGGSWALINFAIMNLTIFEALMLLIGYFVNPKHAAGEKDAPQLKKHGLLRALSLPVGIVSAVAFCLTENIHLTVVFVDRWTLLMAVIALVQTILVVLSRKQLETEPEEK